MKVSCIAVLFLVLGSFKSESVQSINSSRVMIDETEKNKELVKYIFISFAKKNLSYVDSLYAGDFVGYAGYEGEYLDLAGFKKSVTIFSEMFSRFEIKIEDIVAERDVVSTRESWKVVRASDNKKMIGETMHWFRIKNGQITEEWSKGWEWLAQ